MEVLIAVGPRLYETDRFARLNDDLAVPDRSDADLGSLEVLKDADGRPVSFSSARMARCTFA